MTGRACVFWMIFMGHLSPQDAAACVRSAPAPGLPPLGDDDSYRGLFAFPGGLLVRQSGPCWWVGGSMTRTTVECRANENRYVANTKSRRWSGDNNGSLLRAAKGRRRCVGSGAFELCSSFLFLYRTVGKMLNCTRGVECNTETEIALLMTKLLTAVSIK